MQNTEIKTTCSYCGVGCGIIVTKDSQNGVSIRGDQDHPVNRGMLCSKGRNLHYVVNDTSDRILHPEMRWSKNQPLEQVSWDDALDRAAAVFSSIIKKYGPDSVGFYISGQCLTEEYYLVNKLVKGFLKTNNIDTNSRLCMSSAVVGYKKTFGEDSVPIAYEDIELADTFLITGANPAWCHPILYRRLEQHKEKNPKVKVIVIDPRRTDTAAAADLHLQIIPGSDVILYHAIAKKIIEKGYVDHDFVRNNTENFNAYKDLILSTSLEKASKLCGISIADINLTADLIGKAKGFITLWAMGLNQSVVGVDKNTALLNISLLTGHVGKPGSGPFSLTGQPNAMGGREVGGMASLLAAHKELANPEHRQEVADFWGVDTISEKPGLTATEMFEALESGKMKAVWIICTNPLVSLPDSRKVENALKKAKFVVVQDISHNADTAKFADLLLPAAGWLEKEGTMTNSERRISYLPKGINPPGEALPDIEILIRFAKKMNFNGFNFNTAEEIYAEHCALTKNTNIDISFLNYSRLKNEGTFQWPVPDYGHPGTPRLFTDKKFYTPSQKAIFNLPSSIENKSVQPNDKFPFILTTGRVRDQWHTMTKTGKVARLMTHTPTPTLEINPIDAFKNNIQDGDIVEVNSENGNVRVKAKITDAIREKVVFLPMHWGKKLENDLNRTNNLTNTLIDPISKEPDFKFTSVSVKKYKKPVQKIAIVGAGAAAFRFIQNYRELNPQDEIIVFSNETNPFYNRVLLPEYMTGEFSWEQLLKVKDGAELNKLNITMHTGVVINAIDSNLKIITDSTNKKHTYDILLLATGSRPFVPENAQLHLPGRFTMRKKEDADRLKNYLNATKLAPQDQHVVIIGGGLLGLELAAALKHKKVKITIIQRASRLMERQLDRISSKLLAEEVQSRDIQIYFDNEVSTVFETDNQNEIEIALKSGRILTANAIVYSIGTIPNIEIAKEAGLVCGRGVKVNQYMQSSNPNIYALGEIAEFNGQLFGITSAAEEQADILANYLAGDIGSFYKGSVLMNILKLEDINLCSIGQVEIPANDDSYEEIVFADLKQHYYKKCIVKDDLLVGAILMGDKNEFAEFKTMIETKTELADKRNSLLRGKSDAKPVIGKLVCSCSQVGSGNIEETIRSGVTNFTDLCKNTGAGLGCGSCKTEVKELLAKCI
ncbi:nitrate reductase [Flavobacterium agrisoli]|uniref:Molybdopterin-dependent oxidoreductase n=1 Tax=Flavobacterium agrisoli TaxID=2793066 RepID=A0A934PL86_9FLAO|nr:nitrate reductase [Flavobacterium agrisoli]MBK0368556.1 molybdopterin-dependent oxidoreductase [Flavobacterium agrisoli]